MKQLPVSDGSLEKSFAQFMRSEFSFAQSLRVAVLISLGNWDYMRWHDPCVMTSNPASAFYVRLWNHINI
jgi:hypothetical protein